MISSVPHVVTVRETSAADAVKHAVPVLTLESLARFDAGAGGALATIDFIEGDPSLRRRLLEAGFTSGCRVRFVMATPFGDPLVFSLRGASIALRKSEARCVRVRF